MPYNVPAAAAFRGVKLATTGPVLLTANVSTLINTFFTAIINTENVSLDGVAIPLPAAFSLFRLSAWGRFETGAGPGNRGLFVYYGRDEFATESSLILFTTIGATDFAVPPTISTVQPFTAEIALQAFSSETLTVEFLE
jgi:hypothetical protein